MNWTQSNRTSQILGLTLDHDRLEAVVVRRTGESVELRGTTSAPLTLDLLKNEPELVGREIRKILDAGGIRERRCVASVPLAWALTLHGRLPEIGEADLAEFLSIEAERGFPRDLEELLVAVSRQTSTTGAKYAMQIGVPRDYLARLEAILEAAQLKPEEISFGITSLPDSLPVGHAGQITVRANESKMELLVASGGGISSLRVLDGMIDEEGGERRLQTDLFVRELRISLRQLPEDLRESVKGIRVSGPGRWARQLAEELPSRVAGLVVTFDEGKGGVAHGLRVTNGTVIGPALAMAARHLAGVANPFEFLAPKPSLLQQLSERYSGKRLAWGGAVAAVAALLTAGSFLAQQARLGGLRTRWAAMKPRVADVEDLQGQVRKFRPWFQEGVASLSVLRRLTESFPEEGTVTAKSIEMQNATRVTVAGTARDPASLMRTIEKLRAAREVANVQVGQIGGKAPLQFTFTFNWGETATP